MTLLFPGAGMGAGQLRKTTASLGMALLLGLPFAVATGEFQPGESQWVSMGDDTPDDMETESSSGDGDFADVCPKGCTALFWIVPSVVLGSAWIVSFFASTLPDWRRQGKYISALKEAFSMQAMPCEEDVVPPSGIWTWRAAMVFTTLDLTFQQDGTFSGEGKNRAGFFLVRNGRYNVTTGDFVWEQVQPNDTSCWKLFMWNLGSAVLMSPLSIFKPLDRVKMRENQQFLVAPRTFVVAKGTEGDDGAWSLGGSYVCYDNNRSKLLRGKIADLARGQSTKLEKEEVEVRSPVGSRTCSPKSSPRRSAGLSPGAIDATILAEGMLAIEGLGDRTGEPLEEEQEDAEDSPLSPNARARRMSRRTSGGGQVSLRTTFGNPNVAA